MARVIPKSQTSSRRIMLVNDNTDNPNIGCRATSIALGRLLSAHGHIVATAKKDLADRREPLRIRSNLLSRIRKRFHWGFDEYCVDWISEDIEKNAERLVSNRNLPLRMQSFVDTLETVELVVVNGEGSAIFRSIPRRDLLFQMSVVRAAKLLGKEVAYVNAMVSDPPCEQRNERTLEDFVNTLYQCDYVTLRDNESFEYVKNVASGLNCHCIPDALFSWPNPSIPPITRNNLPNYFGHFPDEFMLSFHGVLNEYVVISGSSLAVEDQHAAHRSYGYIVSELIRCGLQVLLLPGCKRDEPFLSLISTEQSVPMVPLRTQVFVLRDILANATAFVSGRYHPSILAASGGTPCVFLGSNSHKTRSLQELLGYTEVREFNAWPSEVEAREIASICTDALFVGEDTRQQITDAFVHLGNNAAKLPELLCLCKD